MLARATVPTAPLLSASRVIVPAEFTVKPTVVAAVRVLPSTEMLSTTREPPVIAPVVVIVDAPVSMLPKPEVILPASKAPTVVTFGSVSNADSKYVSKSVRAT